MKIIDIQTDKVFEEMLLGETIYCIDRLDITIKVLNKMPFDNLVEFLKNVKSDTLNGRFEFFKQDLDF